MNYFADLLRNSKHQFLILNLLGWFGYFITSSFGMYYWDKPISYYYVSVFGSILGFLITIILRLIYRPHTQKKLPHIIALIFVVSFISSLVWVLPVNIVYYNYLYTESLANSWVDYFMSGSRTFYIFCFWSCLYFGLKFYIAMEKAKERALKANALAHQAQLKMLRYQLNPHFLFNTLNAISTLILDKNHVRANEMVVRLSHFLRHSLDNDPMQKVSLEQELETLELYLSIEKVRFDEKLRLDFEVSDSAKIGLIPSLILQPLVENAIKYAVTQSERGGSITFTGEVNDKQLNMILFDDGPGMEQPSASAHEGCGVGLKNTQERLLQIYGDEHEFELISAKPHGLKIKITLPYETVRSKKS